MSTRQFSFALDADGDWSFDDTGNIILVEDVYELVQRLNNRLNIWAGEWFLNLTEWTPYREQILVKNPNLALVAAAFKTVIATTPGVVRITDFELDFDASARTLDATFDILSEYGEVEISAEQQDWLSIFALTITGPIRWL